MTTKKVLEFIRESAIKIAKVYGFIIDDTNIYVDNEYEYYIFFSFFHSKLEVDCTVMQSHLRKDFWLLDSLYDWWQLTEHNDYGHWLRNDSRLIAQALGQNELWLCEDKIGYNGGGLDSNEFDLAQWLANTKERIGSDIPEFRVMDRKEFPGYRDEKNDDSRSLHCIFHDTI